jgi:hypothetical protein
MAAPQFLTEEDPERLRLLRRLILPARVVIAPRQTPLIRRNLTPHQIPINRKPCWFSRMAIKSKLQIMQL